MYTYLTTEHLPSVGGKVALFILNCLSMTLSRAAERPLQLRPRNVAWAFLLGSIAGLIIIASVSA